MMDPLESAGVFPDWSPPELKSRPNSVHSDQIRFTQTKYGSLSQIQFTQTKFNLIRPNSIYSAKFDLLRPNSIYSDQIRFTQPNSIYSAKFDLLSQIRFTQPNSIYSDQIRFTQTKFDLLRPNAVRFCVMPSSVGSVGKILVIVHNSNTNRLSIYNWVLKVIRLNH